MRLTHRVPDAMDVPYGAEYVPPATLGLRADVLARAIRQLRPDLEPHEITRTVGEIVGAGMPDDPGWLQPDE